LTRTDAADVARVESKTFMVTKEERDAVAQSAEGIKQQMGNWMSPETHEQLVAQRFDKCMKGST
jgi:phosphoenolpyruvate carboxykinase (GTP)